MSVPHPCIKKIVFVSILLCWAAGAFAASMSPATYRKLQAVEALMAENQFGQARKRIDEMLSHMPGSEIDRAYVYHTAAMLALHQSNYRQAKSHLKSAHALNCFPPKTQLYVLRTLAGLCMQEEHFGEAIGYYRAYLKQAPEPDRDISQGLAAAYYHRLDYPSAIAVLTDAIRQFEPNTSLYLMLFSSYYEMKQLTAATQTLEKMIRIWPETDRYWLQLAGLYIERKAYDRTLDTMQAAMARGVAFKESDLLSYVYTLYENHLPYKAAVMLDQAMAQQVVTPCRRQYELLSTLYQEAKERRLAIEALKKAAAGSSDGECELRIARICFEMENAHNEVIEYANLAISKGLAQCGNAHMLMAAAYSEAGKREDARKHLLLAKSHKETQAAATRWLQSMGESESQ
ncbi:MAG: hypothetical protein CR984_00060 [Proteobacteria bacterium]|nr:MAG: hypothetical protein CR984_00060 [Pseudomonadota bacterium]